MRSYLPTLKHTEKMKAKKLKIMQEKLIEIVYEGNVDKVKSLLENCSRSSDDVVDPVWDVKELVNGKDENGLSPLQISASLGSHDICNLLINCGADIDISSENCPSPLMLAASNSHYNVVELLLERNASIRSSCPDRTAADEAALKGHTEIEKLINNHVIKRAIDLYFETAKIEDSEFLRRTMNDLLKNDNKHPVRLILNLRDNNAMRLQTNLLKIIDALVGLREQQHRAGNGKLSLMCHSIKFFFVVAYSSLYSTKPPENARLSDKEILDKLIKTWLQNQPKNGYSQDLLIGIQGVINDYPFKDSELYKNITSAPLNQFSNEHSPFSTCETCRNRDNIKFCNGCGKVKYCSRDCQLLHWSVHKTECNKSPLPRRLQ